MTSEYRPRGLYASRVDPERCKASVPFGGRRVDFHQCTRKPWKDGWCKQHHPDSVAERRAQSKSRWKQRQAQRLANSPLTHLRKAREEIAQLKARIAELEAEGK